MIEVNNAVHILPTRKNAERLQQLTAHDLRASGVNEQDLTEIADPENPRLVAAQRMNLLRHPSRYAGVTNGIQVFGGDVLAFLKVNEWRAADELPFADEEEQARLKAAIESDNHHLATRPLGIFALSVDPSLDQDIQVAHARRLVQNALRKAGDGEIRMSLRDDDPLTPMLTDDYRFEPTGRTGEPLRGLVQELYIRPEGIKLK